VVFAALDWGLGHATRSVPLLRHIQQKGCQLSIAASGAIAELLHNECPGAEFLDLPGYGITYPGQGRSFRAHIVRQGPSILAAIRRERDWLARAMPERRWDLILSDNRYGFTHPDVPSAIITHQLRVISGYGTTADDLLRKFLYTYINRFTECWVPDLTGDPNLAGMLSHPTQLPKARTRYLGLLSRLNPEPVQEGVDLLVLLSGPEPQRTLLENTLLPQIRNKSGRNVLVRGLPGTSALPDNPGKVQVHNHLPSTELSTLIAGAKAMVCRPGYSTLMDLIRLGKSAVLVPTPGQTEQEYLAERAGGFGWFPQLEQDGLVLDTALQMLGHSVPPPFSGDFDHFKKVVDAFVV